MPKAGSARGVFAATGKRRKKVPVLQDDGTFVLSAEPPRKEDEFHPTPPEATRAYLSAELDRVRELGGRVWEPAAGDGAMVRELEAVGLDVCGTDLVDRGAGFDLCNFFRFRVAPRRIIITNPPFAECNWQHGRGRWLVHALDNLDVDYMALLLPWSFPGAGGLGGIWAKHPPARVYLMRFRIDFTGEGAPPSYFAWFVWDRAWQGETVLRMLDGADARQHELFGGAA